MGFRGLSRGSKEKRKEKKSDFFFTLPIHFFTTCSIASLSHPSKLARILFSQVFLRCRAGRGCSDVGLGTIASAGACLRLRQRATMASATTMALARDGDATSSAPPPPPFRHVATAFVSFSPDKDRSLPPLYALVKRSEAVSTYKGKWGAVSGGIEDGRERRGGEGFRRRG